jgi:hypothetical protein
VAISVPEDDYSCMVMLIGLARFWSIGDANCEGIYEISMLLITII